MIEKVLRSALPNERAVTFLQKANPIWWLMNGSTWTAPLENNGEPYIPEVTNQFMRDWYWWWRNPAANFVGYVIGVQDRDFIAIGPAPVMQTTKYDAEPPAYGWKVAVLHAPASIPWLVMLAISFALTVWSVWFCGLALFSLCMGMGCLPFVSYSGRRVLWYFGWRPYSGGFGIKFNIHRAA